MTARASIRRIPAWSVACAFALVFSGCASTRFGNISLSADAPNVERRSIDVSDATRPMILVAVSGGGSRAAALGWSVLRELQRIEYVSGGLPRKLVDDVKVLSSVSGGSVIAADFALHGPAGLETFSQRFLEPDNMRTLSIDLVNPLTWFKLAFSGSGRADEVGALFDRQLFDHKTFADLNTPDRPYLILNATDMSSGEVFAFTPQRFDDICADLDRIPISLGVEASSAVPIVLSPVALRNYSGPDCASKAPIPRWITNKLDETNSLAQRYINLEDFKRARYAYDLRKGLGPDGPQTSPKPYRKIAYLYLLDGGLADNLAIHGLLETISSSYAPRIVKRSDRDGTGQTIRRAINNGDLRNLVVIVINARADATDGISTSERRPGIVKMISSVTSVPINANTAGVSSQMDVLLADLKSAASDDKGAPLFKGMRIYGIQIDFDQLLTGDPAQRELRDKAKSVPTLWTISKDNREVIDRAAIALMHQHPCYQRLLLDLNVAATFIDRKFASDACPQVGGD